MTRTKKQKSKPKAFLGYNFDWKRAQEAKGDLSLLTFNHVNCSVTSDKDNLYALMAALKSAPRPIPVKFINPQFVGRFLPRGRVFFHAHAWEVIDAEVGQYPNLRWWIAADGLVIDEVQPDFESLSEFERVAGSLSADVLRISTERLEEIAERLDLAGVGLSENLQPKEREKITAENRKRQSKAIHNFSSAVADPRFARIVRRAVYRAREKYEEARDLSARNPRTAFW